MNPLGSRTRAEALARLLEDSAATGAGAGLALRLRAVAPALEAGTAPRPEFRAALRTRLLAVAEIQAMAQDTASAIPAAPITAAGKALAGWTQGSKGQRRIGVAAGAMAGVIAFTGVGMAATRSLPGQPFYALKRSAENVQLSFIDGDQAKGSKHLEFAATRLREVEALAAGDQELVAGAASRPLASGAALGGPDRARINDTLHAFEQETTSGRVLLEDVYRRTGKRDPLSILKTFANEQQARLTQLLPSLPASSLAAAQHSLALVEDVQSTSTEQLAIGICGGECFPSNRGPELPLEPMPSPGATASPTPDNNGVPGCFCGSTPEARPEPPTSPPSPEPTDTASPTASPSPTPTETPSPSPEPTLLPVPLPVPLPTDLPTDLPVPLPSPIPGLLPTVVGIVDDTLAQLP